MAFITKNRLILHIIHVQQNYKFNHGILFLSKFVIHLFLQTFPGNTDQYNVVDNQMPAPVTALCLRFHPLTFVDWVDIKIEVYGCMQQSTAESQTTTTPAGKSLS